MGPNEGEIDMDPLMRIAFENATSEAAYFYRSIKIIGVDPYGDEHLLMEFQVEGDQEEVNDGEPDTGD